VLKDPIPAKDGVEAVKEHGGGIGRRARDK